MSTTIHGSSHRPEGCIDRILILILDRLDFSIE